MNMHLKICRTLFKTNCHINFNMKRFYLSEGNVEQQWGEIPSCRTTCSEGENLTPAVPQNRAVNKGYKPRILPSFYGHNINP